MNFKRNFLGIITLICSVLCINGCSANKAYTPFTFIEETADLHEEIVGPDGSYIKYANYSSYKAKNSGGEDVELGSTYDILYEYTGRHIIKSTGDRRILVVPVEFSDFTIENLGVKKDEYISNLEKAFFGASKNNKFVSVSEFYNRSSYGKLRISGSVCDRFYTFPKTVAEINKDGTAREAVQDAYTSVLKWYDDTYHRSLDDYRLDPEHGNNDIAIYLVYTFPTEMNAKNSTFFWAYTFSDKPLSWSSYSCMNTLSGDPDAHTFIHETGHLFGLQDYYPTEENSSNNNTPEPAGRIDMMDCSVGDHTAFSKMMLDWVRPYHVKNSCNIEIKALVNTGDLILINDNWNGSVFDEYYLIELYTPLDLNFYDSNNGNNLAKLPSLPGIKIYHVDARLGYFENEKAVRSSMVFKQYCDVSGIDPSKAKKNINIVHDNSTYPKATEDQPELINYLYELQLNHVGTVASGCAANINLFHNGDTFEDFRFNKENATNYKISISGLTYREATISIEKI